MEFVKALPKSFAQRYHGWKATQFEENKAWFQRLAEEGQRPRAMVIACCDSRVHVTSIFGAERGEFFIHRNIANLVPPYQPDGDLHGTSATIEYAVTALKVANIIVMGHSRCGGIEGCLDMCDGNAPDLEDSSSFVGRWMDLLRGAHQNVAEITDREEKLGALERAGVLTSLTNLMTFPFVNEQVEKGALSLHGLWHNISSGALEGYDPAIGRFVEV